MKREQPLAVKIVGQPDTPESRRNLRNFIETWMRIRKGQKDEQQRQATSTNIPRA